MLDWIAEVTGARAARRRERIQSLWSDYGEVFRVELDGGVAPTAIVKRVAPPAYARGTTSDDRKRRSYDVEVAFYRDYAPRCGDACRVARLYGSRLDRSAMTMSVTSDSGDAAAGDAAATDAWWFVLEDLDAVGFAGRREHVDAGELDACLAWLAAFHARFLGERGDGLWPQGTYWHLATRMDELAAIRDRELGELAHDADAQLAAARFQTIVHGDAKEANFCFGPRGVAAVDFQYAGRGCGMKDVAYLLHGHDDAHLERYFEHLRGNGVGAEVEREWRALFPIAQLDFQRFLAGWRG